MAGTKTKYRRTSKGLQKPVAGLAAVVSKVEAAVKRATLPDFSPGDTIRVQVRIKEGEKERLQAFEGVVISRKGAGANRSFTVRKIAHGVGVERIFMETSPKLGRVEVVQAGRVRRAKLYYLRRLVGKAARIDRDLSAQNEAQEAATAAAPAKK